MSTRKFKLIRKREEVEAGVTDHGELDGLADDDHPQYGLVASTETISAKWTFSVAPEFTSFDLGHASDTTFTRVSAGKVAIEGVNIAMESRAINTQHSLTGGGNLSADRTLNLVNDTASPGNDKVYGTNASGTRGWYNKDTTATIPTHDPRIAYYHYYDFMWNLESTSDGPWDFLAAGTGANGRAHAPVAGHPGVFELDAGTGGGYCSVLHSSAPGSGAGISGMVVGGGVITVDWVFMYETLVPTGANLIYARLGLMSDGSEEPTHGIWVGTTEDGGVHKLIGIVRASDVEGATLAANGFTVSADTWYHARVVVAADGASAEFFVNGTSLGTLSSGLPTAALTEGASYQRIASSGTEGHLLVDCVQCHQIFTTPRWT